MRATVRTRLVLGSLVLLIGLAPACRSAYYSVWEALGREKRDLLRSDIEAVKKEQDAAAEQFTSALDRLRALYKIEAGELEPTYDRLSQESERARARAEAVSARIRSIETVARDLFAEWEGEIGQISRADLRAKSRARLDETRRQFGRLSAALREAEAGMAPVLTQLNDYVLYLKHELNAAAVGGLGTEAKSIEADIAALLADLRKSIAEADRFLRQLPD